MLHQIHVRKDHVWCSASCGWNMSDAHQRWRYEREPLPSSPLHRFQKLEPLPVLVLGQPDWTRKIGRMKMFCDNESEVDQQRQEGDLSYATSEANDGTLWALRQSHPSRMWGRQSRPRNCAHSYRTSQGLVVSNRVLPLHQAQELLSIHEQINPDYPLVWTAAWA